MFKVQRMHYLLSLLSDPDSNKDSHYKTTNLQQTTANECFRTASILGNFQQKINPSKPRLN